MSDKYDPDRMASEDLDLNDPEAVDAWLENPVTKALHEDLGRAFRQLPTEAQQAQLQQVIAGDQERLKELRAALTDRDYPPETRDALERLLEALEQQVAAARLRMLELDVDGPDEPR